MKPEEAKRGNEQKGTVSENESNKVGRKMNGSKTRGLRGLRGGREAGSGQKEKLGEKEVPRGLGFHSEKRNLT